jgi:ATP-dependent helicase/nuclease subunit B
MAVIARQHIDFGAAPAAAWQQVAAACAAWAAGQGVPLRDVVVLVPLAQHLALARRAFARAGGWMPRVDTLRTLAAALPAEGAAAADGVSLNVAQDRVRATQALLSQGWARTLQRRDARGFEQLVARFVDTAQRLARTAAAVGPGAREAWLARARALLAPEDGPGGTERLLARMALEWAAASGPWAGDALHAWQPGAWVLVEAGGEDPAARALLEAASCPTLRLQADPDGDPLAAVPATAQVALQRCESFEDEARQAAAQLITLLAQGQQPLALIAQDRVLVRRVAALLARRQVAVLDETGWKLSTSRAAAGLMALLRAASPVASSDDWLDWLKSLPAHEQAPSSSHVGALEHQVRRHGWTRAAVLADMPQLEGPAQEVARWAQDALAPLRDGDRTGLAAWMQRLAGVLQHSGQLQALQSDAAGQQVLQALRLDTDPQAAWAHFADAAPLRLDDFVHVVDELLENAVFEPPPPAAEPAVVITPLRRALLRPFAAAVLPGADDRRLGAPAVPDALLGEAMSVALGLPSAAQRQREEALAFAHLLCLPRVLLLHRHQDEGELLGASPLVERLALQVRRHGRAIASLPEALLPREVLLQPQPHPQPQAGGQLPAVLSASTVEALRDCPYRFFSRAVLNLREADELDDEAQKRDYGNWLHDVLFHFHQQRPAPRSAEDDAAALHALALERREQADIDEASFLPFEASFERFVQHYVPWLHERDAQGVQWLEGEAERRVAPPELQGVTLFGRIDRIDALGDRGRQLIDYKTSAIGQLKAKVRNRLEDTQLAFYAALELLRNDAEPGADPAEPPPLDAMYLALDENSGLDAVPHADVADTARELLRHLAEDLQRLRGGAALPALGEGRVCEFCEARGLCRRDHWPDPLPDPLPESPDTAA